MEMIQAVILLALLGFAFFMEKSMRSKIEELPSQTEQITDKITVMTEELSDIADLLNEAMHAVGNSAIAQTPSSPIEAILGAFIGNMTSKANHGHPTQQEEWEVLPPNDDSTTQETTD